MTCFAPALAANLETDTVSHCPFTLRRIYRRMGVYVHGKDTSPASDIEHDLVLENVLVLYNGIHV